MKSSEAALAELVRAIVKQELKKIPISGHGGSTLITSDGDIHLDPIGGHRAFYKGVEIGTGSGSGTITGSGTTNYLAKFVGSSSIGNSSITDTGSLITALKDIYLYESGGSNHVLRFQHPTGGTAQKAEMYLFTGLTVYDFMIYSAGRLEIHALSGILFDDAMAGNIAMGSYKLTGLGAGASAGDSVRYEQVLLLAGGTMSGAIAMGSQKITGLAAGTTNGDALRYEQLVGQYLLLSGGTLTGDTTLYYAGPSLILRTNSDVISNDIFLRNAAGTTMLNMGHIGTTTYITTPNDLELQVGSGKKVKIVVG